MNTNNDNKFINKIKGVINNHSVKRELKKEFDKKLTKFEILNLPTKSFISVILNIEEKTIFIPIDNSNHLFIKSNTVLYNCSDFSKIVITQIDFKQTAIIPVTYNNETRERTCLIAHYEIYKEPEQPTVINHNETTIANTVNIQGDNSGNITQTSNVTNNIDAQLLQLKQYISDYSPKFFEKNKKIELLNLYIEFKDCIINKQNNQSLFDKFLSLLKVVGSAAVSLAKTIIHTMTQT